MNNRKTGSIWEDKACEYLISNNMTIIERNYRCRMGEIDIIGKDADTYIFVEVKYRSSSHYGLSYEAVTPKKQHTIINVAKHYLISHNIPMNNKIRFDVCGFDNGIITYIKNAF